ncbi:MAG: LysM domain-containing protein [Anaerolineae bacterium]|nr:LysM domain-containing protein [Anaerolineae bacterium]
MDPEEEHERWHSEGELVKFMILVGVMLLAVLLVAAMRPLIFDYVIPAALGWEPPLSSSPPQENPQQPPAVLPASTETPGPTTLPTDRTPTGETLIPAATVTPLPLPTATPQSYRVEPGDNLTTIARRFGISVDALAAANAITNPNRLMPGDVLIIPAP